MPKIRFSKKAKDIYIQFTAIIAISIVMTNIFFKPIQVSGTSMYPTLKDGEVGISYILPVKLRKIKRFDIVVVYSDKLNEYLIKRVVGLPGETVEYRNSKLFINGSLVDEDFLSDTYTSKYEVFTDNTEVIKLGKDEYYCVGDNRPNSSDSRILGPFKFKQIVSTGFFDFMKIKKIK